MKIRIEGGIPFVELEVLADGHRFVFGNALLDTGSGATVLLADRLIEAGIPLGPNDPLVRIRGVGGSEFVVRKRVKKVRLGPFETDEFDAQLGGLDYGFPIDAIVGTDLLLRFGAVLDFARLELRA